MLVIPAIDLIGGEAVRLEKGDFARKTVYASRPADKAAEFVAAGATLVHVVDLDGARTGRPVNLESVRAICQVPGIEVELGGGLRSLEAIEQVLGLGVRYVVLGTAAVERLDLVAQACARFPGQVRTGIDARNGEVKIAGWVEGTGLAAVEVARRVKEASSFLVPFGCRLRGGSPSVLSRAVQGKIPACGYATRRADCSRSTVTPMAQINPRSSRATAVIACWGSLPRLSRRR